MIQHSLIFIHGMGVGDPNQSYEELWKLIASHYEEIHHLDSGRFNQLFKPVFINYKDVTFGAKKHIFESAFPNLGAYEPTPWDVVNPIRPLRYFITFFLGDVTAYVSENDNNIRSTFWKQVKTTVVDGHYSIIAHSLGSIIAFDFLYNLLEDSNLFLPSSNGKQTEEFNNEVKEFNNNLDKIKGNFRNLFTFGSTIGLFMMRKGTLWKNEASFSDIINPIHQLDDEQILHSWLNFYDNEDILSYPLNNLFNRNATNANRALKDIEIQTGNLVIDSHTSYWKNNEMAASIAKTLGGADIA